MLMYVENNYVVMMAFDKEKIYLRCFYLFTNLYHDLVKVWKNLGEGPARPGSNRRSSIILENIYFDVRWWYCMIGFKCKIVLYLAILITSEEHKLSKMIYSIKYKLNEGDLFHSTWIISVKNMLDSAGFSRICTNHFSESPDHLNKIIKFRLHDQFLHNWNEDITQGGKCTAE